jgi:succinate-semialdehyde dehydrogenase/glutarate-semialdehyde dehydrogenase
MLQAGSGEFFHETSPLTGELYARIPLSNRDDVERAFRTARGFQPRWAAVPVAERSACLLRLHDLLLDHCEPLLDLICAESGKARMDAYMELVHLALTARYYGRRGPALMRTRRRPGGVPLLTRLDINRIPAGVVGLITPWNYPLTMALADGITALVAGNTIVHKPASQTMLTALAGLAVLRAAGVPSAAWQMVAGPGSTVGSQVAEQADMICFTGSTETGRVLAGQAAGQLKSISAELGGKNPALVLADADIEAAAQGLARAAFNNAGQLCTHIERIHVDARVLGSFRAAFIEAVGELNLAPGLDWDCDVGTLISADQLNKVQAHLADARSKGAVVLYGGRARPDLAPWCHEPTVLEGVTPDADCYLGETFGPLVSLYSFSTPEEAIEQANQGVQGLNASIWTSDHRRARQLARRLRAGTVNINEGYAAALASLWGPMGGMGESGIGRRQGSEGLLRFTETQTVATQRLLPIAPLPGIDRGRFARAVTAGLRIMRYTRRP